MGIDYHCKSKKKAELFPNAMDAYLGYAMRDVDYHRIFELLRINLGLLADCMINYWTPEQVKHMYTAIQLLYDNPQEALYGEWEKNESGESAVVEIIELDGSMAAEIKEAKAMREDIGVLAAYFKILVDNEAYIYIF